MRAMVYRAYGGPERLSLDEQPDPRASNTKVLVRVRATSVNPVDWKIASGKLWPILRASFPAIPGFDVAGEVVDPGGSSLAIGTRVHVRNREIGASAELIATDADLTLPIPDGMSWQEAAALPLAGQTALQALRDACGMALSQAKERVLVIGASGGVGHLAAQIAVAAGAEVTGVCSARNVETVRGLGVAKVIDYTKPNPYENEGPWDIILDCVSGAPGPWLPRLSERGRYASVIPDGATFLYAAANVVRSKKVHAVMLECSAEKLRTLDELYVAGKLRILIDSAFPLTDLGKAWERSISGRAVGKIVVDVP